MLPKWLQELPTQEIPPAQAVPKDRGFYLQLAAFGKQSTIKRFIDEHQLTSQGLDQHYILSGGRHWYVLTAGHYPTRREADEAADLLRHNSPDLGLWVRSARSLQQAIEAAH